MTTFLNPNNAIFDHTGTIFGLTVLQNQLQFQNFTDGQYALRNMCMGCLYFGQCKGNVWITLRLGLA